MGDAAAVTDRRLRPDKTIAHPNRGGVLTLNGTQLTPLDGVRRKTNGAGLFARREDRGLFCLRLVAVIHAVLL